MLAHGQLGRFGDRWQVAHPDVLDGRLAGAGLLPVYPLARGLTQGRLRAIARAALDRLPAALPEWLPRAILDRDGWPAWGEAVRALHRPATPADLEDSLKRPLTYPTETWRRF